MWLVFALLGLGVAAWIVHYFGEVAIYDPALSIHDTLRGLAMASVPAALVAAFIKLFADEFIIALIQKRSKWELAGTQVESVAMVAVGVVAKGVVRVAVMLKPKIVCRAATSHLTAAVPAECFESAPRFKHKCLERLASAGLSCFDAVSAMCIIHDTDHYRTIKKS